MHCILYVLFENAMGIVKLGAVVAGVSPMIRHTMTLLYLYNQYCLADLLTSLGIYALHEPHLPASILIYWMPSQIGFRHTHTLYQLGTWMHPESSASSYLCLGDWCDAYDLRLILRECDA